MTTQESGTEQITDLLLECGLNQARTLKIVEPIRALLDRIADHSWRLTEKKKLNGNRLIICQSISEAIQTVNCDRLIWISLKRTLRPPQLSWLSRQQYNQLHEIHAELHYKFLLQKINVPLGVMAWMSDLSSLSETRLFEVDTLWAYLAETLPQHIKACLQKTFERAADFEAPEDLCELFQLSLFQPIHHYITMRYISDDDGAAKLLPLLKTLEEGILPLGTTRNHPTNRTDWLVAIA